MEKKILIYRAQASVSENDVLYVYIGQTSRKLQSRRLEHEKAALKNDPAPFHQKLNEIPRVKWEWDPLFQCNEEEAYDQEKRIINEYRNQNTNIVILNGTYNGIDNKTQKSTPRRNFGIPKANSQKNYLPGELGEKFLRISGRLKPIINLRTQKIYNSTMEAERKDHISKSTIKTSCLTGKKLPDGTRYAYLDLNDNPILSEGHAQDHYIGKSARKVKELISGRIYNNATEAAKQYGLSSIESYASAKYSIAKNQYVFCFLDKNGNEIKTKKHMLALEKINNKNKIHYVGWPVDFSYEQANKEKKIGYFKTFEEVHNGLDIKNKSHIKAVCDGKRSHVEGYRVALFDHTNDTPILTAKHAENPKKIMRKIVCLNDQKQYKNCSEAGYEYGVEPNQIGLCAKGALKSVRTVNKASGAKERYRFAYLDKSNNPILTAKHNEPLAKRMGAPTILLINKNTIQRLGVDRFHSLSEFCRKTGVPPKRARQYRKNNDISLLGYEFTEIL